MYKNMKIEINSEQPLEEVVKELEKQGFRKLHRTKQAPKHIVVTYDGYYSIRKTNSVYNTTLAQLKQMEN